MYHRAVAVAPTRVAVAPPASRFDTVDDVLRKVAEMERIAGMKVLHADTLCATDGPQQRELYRDGLRRLMGALDVLNAEVAAADARDDAVARDALRKRMLEILQHVERVKASSEATTAPSLVRPKELGAETHCERCGESVEPKAFCHNCGTRLS